MKRKLLILFLVSLLLPATNLRLGCHVLVAGREVPGIYDPQTLRLCVEDAQRLAEELSGEKAGMPELRYIWVPRFRRADGEAGALTEAILERTQGVTLTDGVIVNGRLIGTVRDAGQLYEKLRHEIDIQMPLAAVNGDLSGQLGFRRIFSRAGHETRDADMILLITGIAPVVYTDAEGRLA